MKVKVFMRRFLLLTLLLLLTACASGGRGGAPPDFYTTTITTDRHGNVTQVTDARAQVTTFSWDALNRLTEIGYVGAAALGAELTYDSASGCGTGGGRLCYVSASIGGTAFAYDDLGRVTDVTDTRGGNDLTTSYDYDLAGNITGITLRSRRQACVS